MKHRTVVIVAHPDDETLGCGALLPRLANLTLVHITDGAPRRTGEASVQGFPTWQAYAQERRRELKDAMKVAGVPLASLMSLGIADQGAARALAGIARRLAPLIDGASLVLTHAFEGGHPDHDATSFAVAAARALLGPSGAAISIVEMPLYRAASGGDWARQSFPGCEDPDWVALRLTQAERARKNRMIAAFGTQRGTLDGFGAVDELYHAAPRRDFTKPANDGHVLYDRYDWGVTSTDFALLVDRASRELGLPSAIL